MTANAWIQLGVFLGLLLLAAQPLGRFLAKVMAGEKTFGDRWFLICEQTIYRIAGVDERRGMKWKEYAGTLLLFNACGLAFVFALLRFQGQLPLNPQGFPGYSPDSAFNTSASFTSNTNWQGYVGESSMSSLSQMLGLGTQNFLSAATGLAVFAAIVRGLRERESHTIGNFWVDVVRCTIRVLLPLSFILAILLVSQGVIQNFQPYRTLETPLVDAEGKIHDRVVPMGPAASQIAIKQLGTNGGGFFNANSAHPLENPTPLSNFAQMIAILLIPCACCFAFGEMIGDRKQGWAILATMLAIFIPMTIGVIAAEQSGIPQITEMGVDCRASDDQSGGNMEGKETRYGIVNSSIWTSSTTAASNGSVNAMHDSYTPLGGLVGLWLMQLGEVVFGGVGSGMYGMLMFVIVAVFVAGLMVGRTPEYLGKKIAAFEMKMASLVILIPPAAVLIGTAIAVVGPGLESIDGSTGGLKSNLNNPGEHGFSEVLYAFSSCANNNGSAFAGLSADNPFYNIMLGFVMLVGRFWLIVPVLAIAGSLARKKRIPAGAGTLPTHTPLFVVLLVGVILLVGALTFLPALALGPIVEHLKMCR